MPIDISIYDRIRPAQIQSPFEALSTVMQFQALRDQQEARRDQIEARRLAGEEARAKAQQRAQVAQAYQQSVTMDPTTGRL